jgi:hypothetical protein
METQNEYYYTSSIFSRQKKLFAYRNKEQVVEYRGILGAIFFPNVWRLFFPRASKATHPIA